MEKIMSLKNKKMGMSAKEAAIAMSKVKSGWKPSKKVKFGMKK